jgi:Ca2+-transporting ATPase
MPVAKSTKSLDPMTTLADRKNMVYMNTIATYGRATAIVTETGMSTEMGMLVATIQEIKPEITPLQRSISKLSYYILTFVLVIIACLVIVGFRRGLDWLDVFLLAVAAAVSAIPEGLPAVVTVVLAVGMQIMARRNAIVRKLAAVETLGSATVICSDKTGTLTLNAMTVRSIYMYNRHISVDGEGYQPKGIFHENGYIMNPANSSSLILHLKIGAICNDSLLNCENDFCNIYGDPTEGALVVLAAKAGLLKEDLEKDIPRINEIPFQSEKRYMATLHITDDHKKVVYVKGSVERILMYSNSYLSEQGVLSLSDTVKTDILEANDMMAMKAMRVIATAYVELPFGTEELEEEKIRGKLTFVGLNGMSDPPREEVKESIRLCKQAGIKVVMITGDNKITAESIARQLNLAPLNTITGNELQLLSDDELSDRVEEITVYARIEPLHKLRIVNALKNKGYVVAMTGDGVNDAPALKAASIGISMGISGTDVAKEASDMVLADDNFSSVVAAVDEGRAIFTRLRNVVFFLLSTNLGELLALLLCVGFLGTAPLLPLQIIWVNLVTDTASGIPLGLELKSGDELAQPPRHPKVGLIYPGLVLRIVFMAVLMSIGIFVVFKWSNARVSLNEARTIAFCTMVTFEWFRSFNARSDERTVRSIGIFRNRWLLITITVAIALQIVVVYTPVMQVALGTYPIGIEGWGIAISAGGSLFIIEELRKVIAPKLFSLGKWQPVR